MLISRFAQDVLDGLQEGVAVFDGRGRLAYANRAARRLLGDADTNGGREADSILPQLRARGGRVATVELMPGTVADVVYLPTTSSQQTLEDGERQAILDRLAANGWKLAETARQLGISRTTLWRRLRAYGVHRDNRGPAAASLAHSH